MEIEGSGDEGRRKGLDNGLTLVEVGSKSDGLEELDEFFEHVAESDDVHGPLPAVELR